MQLQSGRSKFGARHVLCRSAVTRRAALERVGQRDDCFPAAFKEVASLFFLFFFLDSTTRTTQTPWLLSFGSLMIKRVANYFPMALYLKTQAGKSSKRWCWKIIILGEKGNKKCRVRNKLGEHQQNFQPATVCVCFIVRLFIQMSSACSSSFAHTL